MPYLRAGKGIYHSRSSSSSTSLYPSTRFPLVEEYTRLSTQTYVSTENEVHVFVDENKTKKIGREGGYF